MSYPTVVDVDQDDEPVSDHHHWWCLVDDGRPRPRCQCFEQDCRDGERCREGFRRG